MRLLCNEVSFKPGDHHEYRQNDVTTAETDNK